jgi:transcriptional regulator with XRE-family HTH domain
MVTPVRIRHHARPHVYLTEHMEKLGLSDETLANRLDVSRQTVWRWQKETWRLDPPKMAALAEAMDLEGPGALFLPPERPSLDAILVDAPQDIYDALVEHARKLVRKAS